MSIRQGILALLADGPMYGYQLRGEFELRTGATWPLNVGQVYSTLSRLERDGMVAPDGDDEEGRARYRITSDGSVELARWFAEPVSRQTPPRDELAIKLAMAVTAPGVDIRAVVAQQRAATIRALQDYTRLKARQPPVPETTAELSWALVLESLIFDADAEVRWLDHCESRLVRVSVGQLARSVDRAGMPDRAGVPGQAPSEQAPSEQAGSEQARSEVSR